MNNQNMLPIGIVLHGTYRIESYLSSGGFGNTYIAKNIEFDEIFAIKEFFIKGICQRDTNGSTISVSNADNTECFSQQREKFKKEARRLRGLNNYHIVKVYDLFEENETAYYVMDYVDGESLSVRLKRTGSPMSEDIVRNYLVQILDALKAIHNMGILHLDIKPANIMVDSHDVVKLIDFGASKQQSNAGGATISTGVSYTNGYAPNEQMAQNYDKFGPWTDFYALGATLFKLLTNQNPPSVSDVSEDETEDKHHALPMPNVTDEMKKLVVWFMQVNRLKRPQNAEEIMNVLDKDNFASDELAVLASSSLSKHEEDTILVAKRNHDGQQSQATAYQESPETTAHSKVTWMWISLVPIVVILLCAFFFFKQSSKTSNENTSAVTAVSSVSVDTAVVVPIENRDNMENDQAANETTKAYTGTDIAVMIAQYLAQSDNGKCGVDYGLFSDNSSLKQLDNEGSEYDDYGVFGAVYRGKLSIGDITLSNSSKRECDIILKGAHVGASTMIINVGAFNDNYEEQIRKSLAKALFGQKLETYNHWPVRDDLYQLANGYLLVHLDIGSSAEFMTIYVSCDKSELLQIISNDKTYF